MRFVRAFTHPGTGELCHVCESEVPFGEADPPVYQMSPNADGGRDRLDFEMHELGAAEDFLPTQAITGGPCSAAAHLFQRMERDPKGTFRAKQGQSLPAFLDCPTSKAAIVAAARAKGPGVIPERVAHWLEYMQILSDAEMDAAGLPRLTEVRAVEFDAIRAARDPSQGPRSEVFKRRIAERASRQAAAEERDANKIPKG